MSSTSDNIDRFNNTVVVLLGQLYSAFPTPIEVNPLALGHSAVPAESSEDEVFAYGVEADHTVTWLEREGFIRIGGRFLSGECQQVQLTLKGITLLGSLPSSITPSEPKVTLIERIKKLSGKSAEAAATEGAKVVVNELFRLALLVGTSGAGVSPTISA